MIFNYYPHRLERYIVSEGRELPNGDYMPDQGWYVDCGRCDAVRSSGKDVKMDDGTMRGYSYQVHMDRTDLYFRIGEKVRIHFDDTNYRDFDVVAFFPYQTKSILYV